MEKKNMIAKGLCQIAILAVFVLLAAGSSKSSSSSSSSRSSSSSYNVARGTLQGGYCASAGFSFVGYADTNSACKRLCESKGYSLYCTGENTTACYCK